MEDIVIIGAGGLGRDILWLIERINAKKKVWNVLGFVDDAIPVGTIVESYPIIGSTQDIVNYPKGLNVVCAIGSAKSRKQVLFSLLNNPNFKFPNLIDPCVLMSEKIVLGQGNIICASTILTVNIKIEHFCIINLDCTIGHDSIIHSYSTIYPSVNVSGNCVIEAGVELGTGTNIIQGITIGENTIVGAGSVVIRNLPKNCTAVGCPAKPISINEDVL